MPPSARAGSDGRARHNGVIPWGVNAGWSALPQQRKSKAEPDQHWCVSGTSYGGERRGHPTAQESTPMSRFADDFDDAIIVRPEHQIDPTPSVDGPAKKRRVVRLASRDRSTAAGARSWERSTRASTCWRPPGGSRNCWTPPRTGALPAGSRQRLRPPRCDGGHRRDRPTAEHDSTLDRLDPIRGQRHAGTENRPCLTRCSQGG